MMSRFRPGAFVALVLLLSVVAACGSSGSSTSGTVLDAGAKNAAQSAIANSTSTSAEASGRQPTSMAEWEALWKMQREAVIKKIKDNGWGWDQAKKVVTGPGGFTIDLSKCPAGW